MAEKNDVDERFERKVLVIGNSALDIINVCEYYPKEDGEVRAIKQYWQKGGNAANTSQVLAQLNVKVELLSSMAKNAESDFVKTELEQSGVDVQKYSVFHDHCGFPTSCCVITSTTGSRTIVHCRNELPEVTYDDFKRNRIDISQYQWIHFEGRGFPDVTKMLQYVHNFRKADRQNSNYPNDNLECLKLLITPTISVELEKPTRFKELTQHLLPYADVAFISKEIATQMGYKSSKDTVMNVKKDYKLSTDMIIICPWGDLGADAIDKDGAHYHSDSFPPINVVDTLGAGDTFNAATICSLLEGMSLNKAISVGCKVAGKKCGQIGFQNLIK